MGAKESDPRLHYATGLKVFGLTVGLSFVNCQTGRRPKSKVAVIGPSTHDPFLIEMEDKVVVSLFSAPASYSTEVDRVGIN
jgi:hypothetical protein